MKNSKIIFYPSLFFQYHLCPDWIYHDLYSDLKEKGELPELTMKLLEQGVAHEKDFIKDLEFEEVKEINIDHACKHTLELMSKGVSLIYQGALQYNDENITYRGRPDLLEKRPGKSKFGDYYYIPLDIKSSKEIKREQKMQLILYSYILENIQGVFPSELGIINSEREEIFFTPTEKDKEKTNEVIGDIIQIMKGKKPPIKLTSTYKQSPWFNKILKEVVELNDIALIYKLDGRAHCKLRELGINKVNDVAKMNVSSLSKIPYASPAKLEKVKLQAQSLIDNEIKWLNKPNIPNNKPLSIYFDIEGDPLLQVQYLFGFWISGDPEFQYAKVGKVKKYNDGKYFLYFLAEKPSEEEQMWKDFIKWLELLPKDNYNVYHYADYERSRTKGMAEAYGSSEAFEHFLSSYIDLAKIIQDSIIFPLYFYSIKDIAKSKFLNFKWRHVQAGGAQSIFWYEKWLETGDKQVLDDIINYNEDDVRATEFLHQWLMNNG